MKTAFLPLPINPEIPVNWPYGLWPVGLGALLAGTGFAIDNRLLMMVGLFGVTPFAIVFMIWKPRWLKPNWLLWMEAHYSQPILDSMFEQARQDKTWSQKVATQAGLKAWAKDMEQRYRS